MVYKIDRLTRSLADFARVVEQFDRHQVSFGSVTQSFNTTSSMGRLTLVEADLFDAVQTRLTSMMRAVFATSLCAQGLFRIET